MHQDTRATSSKTQSQQDNINMNGNSNHSNQQQLFPSLNFDDDNEFQNLAEMGEGGDYDLPYVFWDDGDMNISGMNNSEEGGSSHSSAQQDSSRSSRKAIPDEASQTNSSLPAMALQQTMAMSFSSSNDRNTNGSNNATEQQTFNQRIL